MRLLVSILLVLCSCASKQVESAGLLSVEEKATLGASNRNFVEIGVVTAFAPRRAQEIESAFLLEHGIQGCLREVFKAESPTSVGIEGYLNNQGGVDEITVDLPPTELKACFAKGAKSIALGRGRSGPFKMRVVRAPIAGGKVKTFLLDLSLDLDEGKKLEKPGLPLDLKDRRI